MTLYRVPVVLDGRHVAPLIEANDKDEARVKAEAVARSMSRSRKAVVAVGEPVRELARVDA